jgi:pimeloyl-ACP methyl ester carboxylesterase
MDDVVEIVATGEAELWTAAAGDGVPVVLVHGSWDDHRSWDPVAAALRDHHRVVVYDRRGHGHSTAPPGQGRISEDVDDLVAVIDAVAGGPAHVVGHSYGATVALLAANRRPELVVRLAIHEPPLLAWLGRDPATRPLLDATRAAMAEAVHLLEAGDLAGGARHFAEHVGFGPGSWDDLFDDDQRATFVANAGTWLDQARDPDRLAATEEAVAAYPRPVLITTGDRTPPHYPPVMGRLHDALPASRLTTIPGAGHAPHLSHPETYSEVLAAFFAGA